MRESGEEFISSFLKSSTPDLSSEENCEQNAVEKTESPVKSSDL